MKIYKKNHSRIHLKKLMKSIIFLAVGLVFFGCSQMDNTASKVSIAAPNSFTENQNIAPKADSFSLDYIIGKFDPTKHPDFIEIEKKYASRQGMRMRKDAYSAFLEMQTAALKEGINLKILSAVRPFSHQKSIWEAKWNGNRKVDGKDLSKTLPDAKERAYKILTYSSMPGTSRHHWGTDIDLNSLEPDFFETGEGKRIYEWLTTNAGSFGYCQPYSPKGEERPDGYNEEKWHWSYMPISEGLTKLAKSKLTNEMISGFDGAEAATKIDVVSKYVLGINEECK